MSDPLFFEHVDAERLHADESAEIHVGVKLRAIHVNALRRGFGAKARGHEVRATADQVGRQGGRQRELAREVHVRAGDSQRAIRTRAQQRGKPVLLQRDLLI